MYGLTAKNEERRTPLRGKERIRHSNGVRLISNDVTINWTINRIKQRMKLWDIIRKKQICYSGRTPEVASITYTNNTRKNRKMDVRYNQLIIRNTKRNFLKSEPIKNLRIN